MLISDHIARMIETLIEESGGTIELKRNVMAEQLGCAPSQINYVITSRFTPERGYTIESRRGGGGYIRIIRRPLRQSELLTRVIQSLGQTLEEEECTTLLQSLAAHEIITAREAAIVSAAVSHAAFTPIDSQEERARLRASSVRRVLYTLL